MRDETEGRPRLSAVESLTREEADQVRGGGGPRPPLAPPIDWIDPPIPPILLPTPLLVP